MNRLRMAVVIGLAMAPDPAIAQIPTESAFASRKTFRQEYLEHTIPEITQAIQTWIRAVESGNQKDVRRLVTEDLLFIPLEGWLVRGSEALDSLASYLPRLSGFGITPFDFDAGGSMAAVYGGVYYQLARGTARETVMGDIALVLVQRGSVWKIRSYVERPRPTPDP